MCLLRDSGKDGFIILGGWVGAVSKVVDDAEGLLRIIWLLVYDVSLVSRDISFWYFGNDVIEI